MKSWEFFLSEKIKVENLEQEEYTFFFKKNGRYYASRENSRIIFAKLKTKDTKDIVTNQEDISFVAKDLKTGEEKQFNKKDLNSIEVCSKEEATSKDQQGGKMCKCKCVPCLRGNCEKCRCKNCKCEGCSCSK